MSCGSNEKSPSNAQTETHEGHSHETAATIELDNGQKWVVNAEMKPFVAKGSELVNAYIAEKRTDRQALAARLKEQNELLIQSCTMDGKSHDELHKWLHPHLELVKQLSETTDPHEAEITVQKLQKSYSDYHDYFN